MKPNKHKPIFSKTVPITAPTIPPVSKLLSDFKHILKSGMLTNGHYVEKFENQVAKHLGVKHAVALNSCTSGLMLIIKALKLKGEIIIPSFTFHATAHAVAWNNLTPVFADCDPETYTIDPKDIERKINKKTSAIIGVHLFGNPCDIESLEKLARKYNLKLIFDAAHGFGAKYKGHPLGRYGDAESFSLSPTKLVTSAEGGIVTTNNPELAYKIRIGRIYGDSGNYNPEFSGLSSRMSELHAAVGLASLKILEKNTVKRNKIAAFYKQNLSEVPGISFQEIEPGNRCSYKDFSICIDEKKFGISRDKLAEMLIKNNIITKKYFYPAVHNISAFAKFKKKYKLKSTDKLSKNSLSLPLYSHIDKITTKKICLFIQKIHENKNFLANK